MTVKFVEIAEPVVPSLNRGFSAPITLAADYSAADRVTLMAHDPDPFARWEAGQRYATSSLLAMVAALRDGKPAAIDSQLIDALGKTLTDETLDPAFRALALTLPSEDYIAEQMRPVAVAEIHTARRQLRAAIGNTLLPLFQRLHDALADDDAYDPGAAAAGRRALRNLALGYIAASDSPDAITLAKQRYDTADNMTDRMAALSVLAENDGPERDAALKSFHDRFKQDEQVMDKWLSVQATSPQVNTLERVQALMAHPVFSMRKPNKVRALIGAFAMGNPVRFHEPDGSGYRFVIDRLLELDAINPQVAARLLGVFGQWRRLTADQGRAMRRELQRLAATEGLSRDCTEIASKALVD